MPKYISAYLDKEERPPRRFLHPVLNQRYYIPQLFRLSFPVIKPERRYHLLSIFNLSIPFPHFPSIHYTQRLHHQRTHINPSTHPLTTHPLTLASNAENPISTIPSHHQIPTITLRATVSSRGTLKSKLYKEKNSSLAPGTRHNTRLCTLTRAAETENARVYIPWIESDGDEVVDYGVAVRRVEIDPTLFHG